MSDWELIDTQPGVKTYLGAGDDEDSLLVRREFSSASTNALLDANKAAQNEGFDKRSEMWHAASIPIHVMYEWLTKFGVNAWNPQHSDAVAKLLNSSDYRWCMVKNIIL